MSEALESAQEAHRDARRANGEMRVSLLILGDKISKAQTALAVGNAAMADGLLRDAGRELEAAQGYRSVIDDSHRDLGHGLDSLRKLERVPG
jgi:hypothetical protein